MPSYKLTYFDSRGRAEIARIMFALGGQEFEDVRLTSEEWAKVKPSTPYGVLPQMEVDGRVYGQSIAIASYLAREFGYYGKSNIEAFQVEEVVWILNDFVTACIKTFFEKDEAKKAELQKNLSEVEIPKYFGFFEKLLKNNGTGYFVGNSITLADVIVWDFLFSMNKRIPGLYDKYEVVKALCERVANEPKIKAYVATRKETEN